MSVNIARNKIRIPVDGDGVILAKTLSAQGWLDIQIEESGVSDDPKLMMGMIVKYGREWIVGFEGFEFDDGEPLTTADVDALPVSLLNIVFRAVLEHVSTGKLPGLGSTSDSQAGRQSESQRGISATTAATSQE